MHFKFSPNILSRLGEELIPNPDQGIIELVKNSYDADATECIVELINTNNIGGKLIVSDNGVGMDAEAISQGWLVLGSSKKATREPTAMGRLPVGDKGLGRLAALRLGQEVTLTTRPQNKPGVEYTLTINWSDFEEAGVVEDIQFNIGQNTTEKQHGTEITVNGLRESFTRPQVKRLARELLLLADPFENNVAFRPQLKVEQFPDLEQQVSQQYFEAADYHLVAKVDEVGQTEARVLDWKDDLLFSSNLGEFQASDRIPVVQFELWIFRLNPQNFSAKDVSMSPKAVRDWLSEVGNVHLYYRGLRVKPYGDKGDDWLGLNYARARNPELRPSTSTVIGRVIVEDKENLLVQKTDRLGFIENESFLELKEFIKIVLEWLAKERLRVYEQKREADKKKTNSEVVDAKTYVQQVITEVVPPPSRPRMQKAVQRYETVKEKETTVLREDLQLYRSLATAGTTAAVFAHESGKPVDSIERVARRIERKGQELLGDKYADALADPVKRLYEIGKSLLKFSRFPLHLLSRDKRRTGSINIHAAIDDILDLFSPFFQDAKIHVETQKSDQQLHVRGSVALLESIITNLLTNTINAFNIEGARVVDRQVTIKTEVLDNTVQIKVLDNGLGIKEINTRDIWLPGKTTKTGGTGLGLTIVKDCVGDLGGEVSVLANGELGGAEFTITLPRIGEN